VLRYLGGDLGQRRTVNLFTAGSGKISRGSPELPFDILVDMCVLASDQKELEDFWKSGRSSKVPPVGKAAVEELNEERKRLTIALTRLQQLAMDVPWAEWTHVYDPIGARLEDVKAEIEKRKAGVDHRSGRDVASSGF
jgi:hypothetical protein